MIKLLVAFIIFAGAIYYFNIDINKLVERSGAPAWLRSHGYVVKSNAATSTSSFASTTSH